MKETNEVIVFGGKYCTNCTRLDNKLKRLVSEGKIREDKVVHMDTENGGRKLAMQYGVRSLPTILVNGSTYPGVPGTDQELLEILNS